MIGCARRAPARDGGAKFVFQMAPLPAKFRLMGSAARDRLYIISYERRRARLQTLGQVAHQRQPLLDQECEFGKRDVEIVHKRLSSNWQGGIAAEQQSVKSRGSKSKRSRRPGVQASSTSRSSQVVEGMLGAFRVPGPVSGLPVIVVVADRFRAHIFVAGSSLRRRGPLTPRREFTLVAALFDHAQQRRIEPVGA